MQTTAPINDEKMTVISLTTGETSVIEVDGLVEVYNTQRLPANVTENSSVTPTDTYV